MGLITKNIPQMYKIFVGIPLMNPVLHQKFDEMQYLMIKNLTYESQTIFSESLYFLKTRLI